MTIYGTAIEEDHLAGMKKCAACHKPFEVGDAYALVNVDPDPGELMTFHWSCFAVYEEYICL